MEPSLSDNVLLAQIKYLKNGQSHFQNHYQYVSQGFQLSPVKWKNRYLFIKHRCESSLEKMCVSCNSIFTFYSMRKMAMFGYGMSLVLVSGLGGAVD